MLEFTVMPAPEDDRFLSAREIKAAAAHGHLPLLAERLARDRSWFALASVFEQIAGLPVTLSVLTETVRRCILAFREFPDRRRDGRGSSEDVRTVRLLAGEALIARVPGPALTDTDRQALSVGAGALADAGDLHRAATTFESARDWVSAAEVWGRLGELELMESCLTRDEDRVRTRRQAVGAMRDIQALVAAGERVAALRLAEAMAADVFEAAAARQTALDLSARLVRARSVTFRSADGRTTRSFGFAATPAVLGRDSLADIWLRDPGVSRQHALIAVVGDEPSLTDAGSRSGTFVGGASLAGPLPLRGTTEVTLGMSCRLELVVPEGGNQVLVRGLSGLDRSLLAIVGAGLLPLGALISEAAGTWLEFDGDGAHLCHPPHIPVRIGGQLQSARIDLLHGDALEIGAGGVRMEVA